jgi:hypothetical protein
LTVSERFVVDDDYEAYTCLLDAGTSTIILYGGTFSGANKTFYNVEFKNASTTMTGNNTFNNLKIDSGKTLILTEGTTTKVSSVLVDGATITSSTANPATIDLQNLVPTTAFSNATLTNITLINGTDALDDVTNLQETHTNSSVTLTWTNIIDPLFDHCNIYRDFVLLGQTTGTQYVDNTVSLGHVYQYTVKTVSTAGVISTGNNIAVPIDQIQSIAITPSPATVGKGRTTQLSAAAKYLAIPDVDCTNLGSWSSDNTSIATVNSSGVVTGVNVGTTTIRKNYSGIKVLFRFL